MKFQLFGLTLIALLPCLIYGRPGQSYSSGILFEAPTDVPKAAAVAEFNFEEFHNKLAPLLETLFATYPLSKQNDRNALLKNDNLFDEAQDKLIRMKRRDVVGDIYDVVEQGVSFIPYVGGLLPGLFGALGLREKVVDGIAGKEDIEDMEEEVEKDLLTKATVMVLKTLDEVLEEAFNNAVTEKSAAISEQYVKAIAREGRLQVRALKKKLGLPTIYDRKSKNKPDSSNNQNKATIESWQRN